MTARLVTIPFSHFCEKARWGLDRRGIPFVEEAHLPVFHARATRQAGGQSTPLLVVDKGHALTDSTDILHWADRNATRGTHLFPPANDEVTTLEDQFDKVLGPHARRLGYFHLLRDLGAMNALLASAPVPARERLVATTTLPAVALLMRLGLGIPAPAAAESRARVQQVFADVDRLLSDGRRYIAGDVFTAADITFASLAAPVVMPPRYASTLLPMARLGRAFLDDIMAFRSTRAGAFVLDLYAHERDGA
jgi:glutathione S-transferase